MRKITKQKSILTKLGNSKTLPKKKKRTSSIIETYLLIFFGMILGFIIISVTVGKNIEDINKNFAENAAINVKQDFSPKYPADFATDIPLAIFNVIGLTEAVSESEIKIKTSTCQEEYEFIGKINAETEIVKKERRGDVLSLENVTTNISEIKKGDLITLEAYDDISEKNVFETKRVIIEEPLVFPDISLQ